MSRIPIAEDRGSVFLRRVLEAPKEKWPFDPQQLVCGGDGCTARVSPVVRHKKRGTWVEAHFRLRAGHGHSPGCKYDVERRVQVFAAEYADSGTVVAEIYRLDLRDPEKTAEPAAETVGGPGRRSNTGVEYHPSGDTIPRTLQAAKQIRRIIHEFVDAPSVAARFRAQYRGVTYRWAQFFFEAAHDSGQLAASISGGKEYPRAVRGTVRFRDAFRQGQGVALVLATDQQAEWPRSKQGVKVTMRANDPSHLPYEPGDTVIAYGLWGRFPLGGAKDEAQLWVNEPRNVTTDD